MDDVYPLLDSADAIVVATPGLLRDRARGPQGALRPLPALLGAPLRARRASAGRASARARCSLVGGGGDPFGTACAVTPTQERRSACSTSSLDTVLRVRRSRPPRDIGAASRGARAGRGDRPRARPAVARTRGLSRARRNARRRIDTSGSLWASRSASRSGERPAALPVLEVLARESYSWRPAGLRGAFRRGSIGTPAFVTERLKCPRYREVCMRSRPSSLGTILEDPVPRRSRHSSTHRRTQHHRIRVGTEAGHRRRRRPDLAREDAGDRRRRAARRRPASRSAPATSSPRRRTLPSAAA